MQHAVIDRCALTHVGVGLLSVAFLVLVLAAPLSAQVTFQRTYGGTSADAGQSVLQTTDGGYVIAGKTESFGAGYADVYLIKTDAAGDTTWTRTCGGAGNDWSYSVAQTADGGYVIAGKTASFGAGLDDVYFVKTDAAGDTMWTRTYGGTGYDWAGSVARTADGGYVIGGWTRSFGAGLDDIWLVKIDASGDTMWTRTYGGTGNDRGHYSAQQTADGGYVITGFTRSFGAGLDDVWLIKTDAAGDTVWTRTWGGTASDMGYSVAQTVDGGYVVAGYTQSFGAGSHDVWLIKTDASGDTMWTRIYGGMGSDGSNSVRQTADGGYVIAGWTRSFGAGESDVWLIKTDASGDTMWTRTFGGASGDLGYSARQTADGGYIIAGYTASFGGGGNDVWLIKTDANGNIAIAEPKPPVAHKPAGATIVRGVLHMPETGMTNTQYPMALLDIAGSKAMNLSPGLNDIRHLSPGVYFVHQASSVERPASSVRRVILTR